jgi:hypothetical protein
MPQLVGCLSLSASNYITDRLPHSAFTMPWITETAAYPYQSQNPAAAAWSNPDQNPAATTWLYQGQHRSVSYFALQPEPNARRNLERLSLPLATPQKAQVSIQATKDKTQAIKYLQGCFKKHETRMLWYRGSTPKYVVS